MGGIEKPSADVLRAFGAAGATAERLQGGRGLTWRAGDVILRPRGEAEEADWRSGVLALLPHDSGFRTARPVPARDGSWASGGWEAWTRLSGSADERRVVDVIRAGEAFHRALAGLTRPAFIAKSHDLWSVADRMAWGEEPLPRSPLLDRLARRFAPVRSPSQVIHGDLLGNVLFAPDAAPAVIDWAPYWRPAGLGAAIAAVDAACWHGWPPSRLGELGRDVAEWPQLLMRALAFRIATQENHGQWDRGLQERHDPVVAAVEALC